MNRCMQRTSTGRCVLEAGHAENNHRNDRGDTWPVYCSDYHAGLICQRRRGHVGMHESFQGEPWS